MLLSVGLQVRPDVPVHDITGSLPGSGTIDDIAGWLRGVTSVALSYSPEARTRAGEGA